MLCQQGVGLGRLASIAAWSEAEGTELDKEDFWLQSSDRLSPLGANGPGWICGRYSSGLGTMGCILSPDAAGFSLTIPSWNPEPAGELELIAI